VNRRQFAGLSLAAIGGIFAPKFGQWYKRGSGLIVRDDVLASGTGVIGPRLAYFEIRGNGVILGKGTVPVVNGIATIPQMEWPAVLKPGYYDIRVSARHDP